MRGVDLLGMLSPYADHPWYRIERDRHGERLKPVADIGKLSGILNGAGVNFYGLQVGCGWGSGPFRQPRRPLSLRQ